MTPTRTQRLWLKKHLPKDAKPTELIPRAYVAAKPSTGVAAVMTPPGDYRPTTLADNHPELYQGQLVYDWKGVSSDLKQGEWVSLVYAVIYGRSSLWYAVPMIPWGRITKEDMKNATHSKGVQKKRNKQKG